MQLVARNATMHGAEIAYWVLYRVQPETRGAVNLAWVLMLSRKSNVQFCGNDTLPTVNEAY